jgi:hypothetical protein
VSLRGYRTELDVPLVGLSSEAVLNEVRSVLEVDARVEQLTVVSATSISDAKASTEELHDERPSLAAVLFCGR